MTTLHNSELDALLERLAEIELRKEELEQLIRAERERLDEQEWPAAA